MKKSKAQRVPLAETALQRHFRKPLQELVTGSTPYAVLLSPASYYGQPAGTHIEVAVLPREAGSRLARKLLPLKDDVIELVVRRTDRASAAFIKELMRRAAQFYVESGNDGHLHPDHLNAALEEMLFSGGSLNAKLLGAAEITRTTIQ